MKETAKLPCLLQPQVPITQRAQLLHCDIKAWSQAALQQGKRDAGRAIWGESDQPALTQ